MPLTKEKKAGIFAQYGGAGTNTGSIEGQIALITERMAQISAHLQTQQKRFFYSPWFNAPGRSPPPLVELPAKTQSSRLPRTDREIRNPKIN